MLRVGQAMTGKMQLMPLRILQFGWEQVNINRENVAGARRREKLICLESLMDK